jgi:hypothetical protein
VQPFFLFLDWMYRVLPYRRTILLTSLLVICVCLLNQCIDNNSKNSEAAGKHNKHAALAGDAACGGCHKAIYATHIAGAHFHTSEKAGAANIKGSFEPGKNSFSFTSGGTVAMEKKESGFYQTVYVDGVQKKSQRFDLIFGSGTKGQSYASWAGNHLVQLPITYFTSAEQWSNSPGYPNKISLNRIITSRCLECHASYANIISDPAVEAEEYEKSTMVLGVSCEKCHGAGKQHVDWQTQHPADSNAKFIINPARFSRAQSLDMCAVCHGGRLQKTKPSFSFTAGDKLSDFFVIDSTPGNAALIDVHGNQYGLLAASKCFRQSQSLTCITCHSPHADEKGNSALFSQRCISCHGDKHAGTVNCKLTASMGTAINSQCTNCHMPEQPSRAIAVILQGTDTLTPAFMHTHLITSYPTETQKVLAYLKKLPGGGSKKPVAEESIKQPSK